jgi:hypothetical protein
LHRGGECCGGVGALLALHICILAKWSFLLVCTGAGDDPRICRLHFRGIPSRVNGKRYVEVVYIAIDYLTLTEASPDLNAGCGRDCVTV